MHANARLTPRSRWTLVQRIQAGRPVAEVAGEMGVSAATGYKWWARWRAEGNVGLQDRSSRPHPRRPAHLGAWSVASSGCAGPASWGRLALAGSWRWRTRRCTGCWCVWG